MLPTRSEKKTRPTLKRAQIQSNSIQIESNSIKCIKFNQLLSNSINIWDPDTSNSSIECLYPQTCLCTKLERSFVRESKSIVCLQYCQIFKQNALRIFYTLPTTAICEYVLSLWSAVVFSNLYSFILLPSSMRFFFRKKKYVHSMDGNFLSRKITFFFSAFQRKKSCFSIANINMYPINWSYFQILFENIVINKNSSPPHFTCILELASPWTPTKIDRQKTKKKEKSSFRVEHSDNG